MDELIQLILGTTRIDEAVYPDTPLISSGMIDSFDIVALLTTFVSLLTSLIHCFSRA
jgi:hypothetical protein